MKCKILHEARGHMRVHLVCGHMTLKEADILEYYLRAVDGVKEVKVYDRTQDAVIVYQNDRTLFVRSRHSRSQKPKAWSLCRITPHAH